MVVKKEVLEKIFSRSENEEKNSSNYKYNDI